MDAQYLVVDNTFNQVEQPGTLEQSPTEEI
jgi:hypothetical protein